LRMAEDEEISLKYIIYEIERAMNKILIKWISCFIGQKGEQPNE
jgi:hypothetical protein